jgi:hypothetical protein
VAALAETAIETDGCHRRLGNPKGCVGLLTK